MKFSKEDTQAIKKIADDLKVPLPALLAIIEVESNGISGSMIDGKLRPTIRYEGHYFDRLCKPSVRADARKAGVSSPTAGGVKNPSSQKARWDLVNKASKFDYEAAYMSCSYGVGQVMGSHWKSLGFKSIQEFLDTVNSGLAGQVEVMARFIKVNKLVETIQALDWSAFARAYNGPAYKKNQYDTKMANAYIRHGGKGNVSSKRVGNLRVGSIGAGVRDLQAMLRIAGFDITVDGDFGPATKEAVMSFQRANGLIVDGIVGPKTQAALTKVRDVAPDTAGQESFTQITEVKQGGLVAAGIPTVIAATKDELNKAIDQITNTPLLAPLGDLLNGVLGIITVVAIVGGIAYSIYGYRKSKQSFTGTR